MSRQKFTFKNAQDIHLSGLIELPESAPRGMALFAHCFTCGKDITSASRICRALTQKGFAVLRFDFTGLGNSDGDFSNTNFSTNVEDLMAAAQHLEAKYVAPSLLIGHSLGGAAVIAAASLLPSVKAVVTIGAPSHPGHVIRQLESAVPDIEKAGEVEVSLAGRPFKIKKQFLEDVTHAKLTHHLETLNKALLIFHSPIDTIVPIDEAAKIYQSANHPKSFITLDSADHLLSQKEDAEYVANTLSAWVARYLSVEDKAPASSHTVETGQVLVNEKNHQFLREVFTDDHKWMADEPIKMGGGNIGPDPYEHLLAALGTCTSMTVRMYANRKSIPLEDIRVTVKHQREHLSDCENCENEGSLMDVLHREISFKGDLSPEQKHKLIEIANKCPVHKTLLNLGDIKTQLVEEFIESRVQ
ncbi:MAG: bifunctional alpha/beta hydrolase/OsmC family protein [Pseudomonadota bacterium]